MITVNESVDNAIRRINTTSKEELRQEFIKFGYIPKDKKMSKVIKKGYMIEVTTWENDGDNYKTSSVDGLSQQELRVLYDYCNRFSSKTTYTKAGFGNSERHGEVEQLQDEIYNAFGEQIQAAAYKLVGTWCDGEYYRVTEEIKMFYVPQDIIIEEVTL